MSTVSSVTEIPVSARFRELANRKILTPQWVSDFVRRTPGVSSFVLNNDGRRFRALIENKQFEQAILQLVQTIKRNPSKEHLSWYTNQLFLEALEPTMKSIIDGNLRTVSNPERSFGWDSLYQACSYTRNAKAGAFASDEKENGPKLENIRTLLEQGKDYEALDAILEFNQWSSSWVGPHVRLATFIPPLLRV